MNLVLKAKSVHWQDSRYF